VNTEFLCASIGVLDNDRICKEERNLSRKWSQGSVLEINSIISSQNAIFYRFIYSFCILQNI